MEIQIAAVPEPESLIVHLCRPGETAALSPAFKAEKGELRWESPGELRIGLGNIASAPEWLRVLRMAFHKRKRDWPRVVSVAPGTCGGEELDALVTGIILGGYNIGLFKSEPEPESTFFGLTGKLVLVIPEPDPTWEQVVRRARETALTQLRIMDLMNTPGNKKPPRTLAKWALESGAQFGYKVTVFDRGELEELNMAALLAVNKGSAEDPVMIVTEYAPPGYTTTIALVGKGVTFDTGGVSIKPSANMHLMKSDMGGAAAVLGTVELAARLRLPVRVVGIIPATENCVDGASLKPGDVIDTYSGKTIEVIDTDAEGRLILADGLNYAASRYKPDVLIDLATLTGSVVQTLGYHAAGLFTSDDTLADALLEAGVETGEKLWRLPLWDDYKDEIASEIADVKNFHGKPLAGAIVAAKFLEVFTAGHPSWAHLDIAGTAYGDAAFFPDRAGTAFGVRLLRAYLEQHGAANLAKVRS